MRLRFICSMCETILCLTFQAVSPFGKILRAPGVDIYEVHGARLTLLATCATCAAWAPSKIFLAWIYFQEWKGTQSCWPSSIVSHRYRFVHQLHWLVCHSFRMLIHLLNEITCHPISLCEVKASLVNHIHRIFKAEPDCAGHEENAEEWKKIILIKLFLVWVVFYDFEARVFLRYGLRMAEAHSWKMFAITNQPFWR